MPVSPNFTVAGTREPECRPLRQHRRKDGVSTTRWQTKVEYHRWVISHKQYLITHGELGDNFINDLSFDKIAGPGVAGLACDKNLGTA